MTNSSNSYAFSISSSNIKSGDTISDKHSFNGFGCNGENISPQIGWKNPPKDTKSFAILVYDPDAPTGSGWWHWVLVNIPVTYSELPPNFGNQDQFALKDGIIQVRNDYGFHKYGGPCPPQGDKPHRYVFTIHALKVDKIDLEAGATSALAGFMVNQNTIAKVGFEGFYGR
jgi:hypothetical protein